MSVRASFFLGGWTIFADFAEKYPDNTGKPVISTFVFTVDKSSCIKLTIYQLYFANMAAQYKYKKYKKYKLYTKSPNASHWNQ